MTREVEPKVEPPEPIDWDSMPKVVLVEDGPGRVKPVLDGPVRIDPETGAVSW